MRRGYWVQVRKVCDNSHSNGKEEANLRRWMLYFILQVFYFFLIDLVYYP